MKIKYPYQQALSQRLRLLLNEERLSSAGLARKLNLPRSTVAKWLAGTSAPDRPRLATVCQALSLDLRAFVTDGPELDSGREKVLLAQAVRYYETAIAGSDAPMISDALALAGAVAFVGLRRRGLPGRLVADEVGNVHIVLRDPDMASLKVILHHSSSRGAMCMEINYSDDAPVHDTRFNFTERGLSYLAVALRNYAATARQVFRRKA